MLELALNKLKEEQETPFFAPVLVDVFKDMARKQMRRSELNP